MRKYILAALVTVSALTAAPAMADSAYPYQPHQSRNLDRDNDGRNDRLEDRAYDQRYDRDRDGRNDRFEDRAHDNRFGARYSPRQYGQWYPGWQHSWYENRHVLPPHRLIRRIERQGFHGVRTVGFSRRGSIRAIAFDQWRRPVNLQVDAYTGTVLRVRPA